MRSRLSNAGAVTGVIDGVAWESDHLLIHGWACQQSVQSSISVHVYVGGAAGTGAILGGYVANQSREMAVSLACSTSGIAHGFTIAIPRVQLSMHEGKAIFVHGISTTNGANLLLNRSGSSAFPTRFLRWSRACRTAFEGSRQGRISTSPRARSS